MKGVILMTALPPTEGHAALIRFAAGFMRSLPGGQRANLTVILSRRPSEPGDREFHIDALRSMINYEDLSDQVKFRFDDYDGPENPIEGQEDEFWHRWTRVITFKCMDYPQYVFSSEEYGYKVAEELEKRSLIDLGRTVECTHIPFNLSRDQNVVRATDVRDDLITNWGQLIPPLRQKYSQSICIFGQESVGKTTLAHAGAEHFDSIFINEWARPYLEGLPSPEVTDDRMNTILHGQAALEHSSRDQYYRPFRFYDTDLLSTLGYWELWKKEFGDAFAGKLHQLWKPKDLYIIPRDNIPFTPDPLRYGGDRRETDTIYWIKLCERYNLRYYVMQERSLAGRKLEFWDQCLKQLDRATGFMNYKRER